MELFTAIDDAHAIIRLKRGVQKQVKLYKRGERVYVPMSGGYVEVRSQEHGGTFNTAHPDVRLIEYEAEGVVVTETRPARLRWKP